MSVFDKADKNQNGHAHSRRLSWLHHKVNVAKGFLAKAIEVPGGPLGDGLCVVSNSLIDTAFANSHILCRKSL